MYEIFWLLQARLIAEQMHRVQEFQQNLRKLRGVSEVQVTVWGRNIKVRLFAADPNAAHIQQFFNEFRQNNPHFRLKIESN